MFRLTLNPRLIGAALAIQAFTLGVIIWNGAHSLAIDQDASMWQTARDNGVLLAAAVSADLDANNHTGVLNSLELLRNNRALRYAGIVSADGKRVASLGEPPLPLQDFTGELGFRELADAEGVAIEHPVTHAGRALGILQVGYTRLVGASRVADFWKRNIAIALAGLMLATLPIALTLASTRRTLQQMQTAVKALQAGEFGQRLQATGPPVVTNLVDSVNSLAAHLDASSNDSRARYEHLSQESRRLNALLHGINAVVWEVDPATAQFRYVNEQAERLTGYPPQEWLTPEFCRNHVHPSDVDWVLGFLSHPGTSSDSFTLDFRLYSSKGDCLWVRIISSVELRDQGPILVGLMLNVTEEKRNEQRIAFLADHDPLTGLINRRRFQDRLKEQIAYNRRYNTTGALLFLDLDQFKYINDSHGHHTGDAYLRQVAEHLRKSLRETDIVGRLGGDEFGVILPNATAESASTVSKALLKGLSANEFSHEGHHSPFSASLGIALFPTHGEKAGELLAKADSAMYNAKDHGRNTFRLYEEGIDVARMQEKVLWEDRIRQALKENRFQLYFQPIVDIQSGVICHYECLLRMIGEDGEVISPGAFIGIAERFGMIRDIDRWVVENAIRTQGTSRQVGRPVELTINLSGRHFGSREMLEIIQETTRRYKADPNSIVFEVTETAAVQNFSEACDFIKALHEMGYRFALDDFGAGFSSFDYLKHIPVDYIKIDGSFVRNLNHDKIDQIFVRAIAEMARGLGVQTIAEFVENEETVEVLRSLGIPFGQGYFFAKPRPRFHEHARVIVATGTTG